MRSHLPALALLLYWPASASADVRVPSHAWDGEVALSVVGASTGGAPVPSARVTFDLTSARRHYGLGVGLVAWHDRRPDSPVGVTPFARVGLWAGDAMEGLRLGASLRVEGGLPDARLLHPTSPRDVSRGRIALAAPVELAVEPAWRGHLTLYATAEPRWRWSEDAGSRVGMRGELGLSTNFGTKLELGLFGTTLWRPAEEEVSSAGGEARLSIHLCHQDVDLVRARYLTAHVCTNTVSFWGRVEPLRSAGEPPWATGLSFVFREDVFW